VSKGSADRGSQEKRRKSKLWCERCSRMRGGSCTCKAEAEREHGKLIMDTLMGAMGYKRKKEEEND